MQYELLQMLANLTVPCCEICILFVCVASSLFSYCTVVCSWLCKKIVTSVNKYDMNLITNMCFPKISYMNSNIGLGKNKPRMELIISLYKLIILNNCKHVHVKLYKYMVQN